MSETRTTDPQRLRTIAASVRADAADADEGTEESELVADLLDVRRVLRCIGRIADRMEVALGEGDARPEVER